VCIFLVWKRGTSGLSDLWVDLRGRETVNFIFLDSWVPEIPAGRDLCKSITEHNQRNTSANFRNVIFTAKLCSGSSCLIKPHTTQGSEKMSTIPCTFLLLVLILETSLIYLVSTTMRPPIHCVSWLGNCPNFLSRSDLGNEKRSAILFL
jgi:hypothetical protein